MDDRKVAAKTCLRPCAQGCTENLPVILRARLQATKPAILHVGMHGKRAGKLTCKVAGNDDGVLSAQLSGPGAGVDHQ